MSTEIDPNDERSLIQLMEHAQSPVGDIRIHAERSLLSLFGRPNFGAALVRIGIDQTHVSLPVRQMAWIILKKYIRDHWCGYVHDVVTVNPAEKSFIRSELLHALFDAVPRISIAVSMCLAQIAAFDVPDAWPELLPHLLSLLKAPSVTDVHAESVLRSLVLITEDLSDLDVDFALQHVVPSMFHVLQEPRFSFVSMHFALSCVCNVLDTLSQVVDGKEDERRLASFMLSYFVPTWSPLLSSILTSPVIPQTLDRRPGSFALRMSALKIIQKLYGSFAKHLVPRGKGSMSKSDVSTFPFLHDFLSSLADLVHPYVSLVINLDSDGRGRIPDAVLSDTVDFSGEVFSLETVVEQSLEVVNTVLTSTKLRKLLKCHVRQVCELALSFAQLTAEQCDSWLSDPNAFVANEDDEASEFSCRIAAQDVIYHLCEAFQHDVLSDVWSSVMSARSAARMHAHSYSWKLQEVSLVGLHSLFLFLQNMHDSTGFATLAAAHPADIHAFMGEWVSADLRSPNPFLRGRALALVGPFASVVVQYWPSLMSDVLAPVLESVTSVSQPMPVRMSGVRALYHLAKDVHFSSWGHIIQPHSSLLLTTLCELALAVNSECLIVVLDALRSMSCLYVKALTEQSPVVATAAPTLRSIFATFLEIIRRNADDPFSCSMVVSDVAKLLADPYSRSVFVGDDAFIRPLLHNIALHAHLNMAPMATLSLEILIELLSSFSRKDGSSISVDEQSRLRGLFSSLFPMLVNIVSSSDKTMLIQHASNCTRAFLRVLPSSSFDDHQLSLLVQLLSRLMSPEINDSANSYLGLLLIKSCLLLADRIQTLLPSLVSAAVERLSIAASHALKKTLLLFLAKLVHMHSEAMINFLSSTTVQGTSETLLRRLLTLWTSIQPEMLDRYECNVSVSALVILFFWKSPEMASLTLPVVKEVELMTLSPSSKPREYSVGIRTRNMAAAEAARKRTEVVEVSAVVVIFHSLVTTFLRLCDDEMVDEYGFDDEEDGSVDDGANDLEAASGHEEALTPAKKSSTRHFADAADYSEMLSEAVDDGGLGAFLKFAEGDEEEEEEDDPDVLADPLFDINSTEFLKAVFSGASQFGTIAHLEQLIGHLPAEERDAFILILQDRS